MLGTSNGLVTCHIRNTHHICWFLSRFRNWRRGWYPSIWQYWVHHLFLRWESLFQGPTLTTYRRCWVLSWGIMVATNHITRNISEVSGSLCTSANETRMRTASSRGNFMMLNYTCSLIVKLIYYFLWAWSCFYLIVSWAYIFIIYIWDWLCRTWVGIQIIYIISDRWLFFNGTLWTQNILIFFDLFLLLWCLICFFIVSE